MLAATVADPVTVTAKVAGNGRVRASSSAVALGLALAPIGIAAGRAVVTGWVPVSDAAYFTVRSRDVLTANHPWLGAWSSASVNIGESIRNLGPLQLDLLAPFTKAAPYSGTAIGVGAVAAAAVLGVWWSARRVLGPNGAVAAMLATLALEATIGSQAFVDPRQQVYLLMPYWALLWLTWAAAMGHGRALAPMVLAASLILQTHFTYLFQTAFMVAVGVGGYLWTARTRWRAPGTARHVGAAAVAGIVCWAQPLWDQFLVDGNLGTVLTGRAADEGVGWSTGIEVVASTALVPPRFWLPGTMDGVTAPFDLVAPITAWIALTLWSALLCGAVVVGSRRGQWALAGLAAVAGVSLVAGVVAAARIPRSAFGVIPQNYYWMWPTAVFMTVGVATALPSIAATAKRWSSAVPVVIAATGIVMAAVAVRSVDYFAPVPSAGSSGERVGRPVLEQLATSLRFRDFTGPVVVDYSRASFSTNLGYVILAELQKAGVEFRFEPGSANLERFGRRRCHDGRPVDRIFLADSGGDRFARHGEVVLADVDAFDDADEAELAALDRRFGDWIRDGTVAIGVSGMEYFSGRDLPGLRRVLSTPDAPATGYARFLDRWTSWGVVDLPGDLDEQFDRWVDLELRSDIEEVTVLLDPASPGDKVMRSPETGTCPT